MRNIEYVVKFHYYYQQDALSLIVLEKNKWIEKAIILCDVRKNVSIIKCKLCGGVIKFKLLRDIQDISEYNAVFKRKLKISYSDLNIINASSSNIFLVYSKYHTRKRSKLRKLRKPGLSFDGFCGENCYRDWRYYGEKI